MGFVMEKKYLIIPISILSIILLLIATVGIYLYTSNKENKKETSSHICAKENCNKDCEGDSEYCKDHIYIEELYNSNNDNNTDYDDNIDYSNNYDNYDDYNNYNNDTYYNSTPTPTKSSSKNYSSGKSYNPYPNNPSDYSDYEDYYYDNEEDFDGIDDAEDYYDEYGGD